MEQTAWNQLISALISLALALLAPLLTIAIQALLARLKLDKNEVAMAAARSAIAYAEEIAAAQLKAGALKISPPQKMGLAVQQLLTKLPGVSDEEAKALITAELPKVGLGAAGFLQAVATAAKQ